MAAASILCLVGPTAAGKTAVAVRVAEALNAELVSVDSALVYRGLDIGSAKPDYPHHLIDICDPADPYSAARFAADARRVIGEIRQRGRRPVLVGGTMLYFRALFEGLSPLPAADPALRRKLEERARAEGWPALHRELADLDPEAAARIHPNHSQRLLRALEVVQLTGEPLSRLHRVGADVDRSLRGRWIAIAPPDRAQLHARIARRFEQMMAAGFLEEVRALHARSDLHGDLPAMRAVGYRQLWDHLEGRCSLDEAVSRGLAATRQLAKRQFTWLRKWPDLHWIHADDAGRVLRHDLPLGQTKAGGEGIGADTSDLVLNYLTYNPM